MSRSDSFIDKVVQSPRFKSFMNKLAIIGATATMVGLLLRFLGLKGGSPALIVGISVLSVVAFMLGSIFPCPHSIEDDNYVVGMQPIWKFAMTLTGWSLAVLLMGLLFTLMHWPGGMRMLIIGGGSLVVGSIAWLYYFIHFEK